MFDLQTKTEESDVSLLAMMERGNKGFLAFLLNAQRWFLDARCHPRSAAPM